MKRILCIMLLACMTVSAAICPSGNARAALPELSTSVSFYGIEFGMSPEQVREKLHYTDMDTSYTVTGNDGTSYLVCSYSFDTLPTFENESQSPLQDVLEHYNTNFAGLGSYISHLYFEYLFINNYLISVGIQFGESSGSYYNNGMLSDDKSSIEWFKEFAYAVSYGYRSPFGQYSMDGHPTSDGNSSLVLFRRIVLGDNSGYDPLVGGNGGPSTKAWAYWRIPVAWGKNAIHLYAILMGADCNLFIIDGEFWGAIVSNGIKSFAESHNQ